MAVQVPCLSCRSATPAGEDAASLSCQGCGAALPPPARAAWLMLRDGAQYGPYTLAQLAAWVAEGRILPKDHVWHQGAAVRLEVDQLPPFGATPAPEPEAVPAPEPASVEAAAPEPAAVAPEPEPAPAAVEPEPEVVREPEPEPAPAEAPEPEPGPDPIETVTQPEPEPEPVEPAASAIPAEAAAPEPALASGEARPRLTVHIPCLSCRSATPVGEDAASVSCQSCGIALPPPAQAAWLMLRDGAQYGPYTTGQLAGYIAERRILPKDNVWYPGAPVRLEVGQLPPFGEVEEQPAAPATPVETPASAEIPAPVATAAPAIPPAAEAPAPSPASGDADGDSLEIQPGETSLGSWLVGVRTNWRDITGTLTVTDRRILFKPKIAGRTMVGMVLSQTKRFKDDHTVVLNRDRVAGVHTKKGVLSTYIYVTTADGAVYEFIRGLVSADPVLAALQTR